MLIVDEAQTLESERGHLLELLLLKLRALNPQIQVVFLSATLPNPRAIARWTRRCTCTPSACSATLRPSASRSTRW